MTLPPVILGVILLAAFLGAFALRKLLEPSVVLSASKPSQPKRQFLLDFSLSLAAGLGVLFTCVYNRGRTGLLSNYKNEKGTCELSQVPLL